MVAPSLDDLPGGWAVASCQANPFVARLVLRGDGSDPIRVEVGLNADELVDVRGWVLWKLYVALSARDMWEAMKKKRRLGE